MISEKRPSPACRLRVALSEADVAALTAFIADVQREARREAYEAAASVCDEGATLEAMDGEDGNAAMVRVLDRQAELLAAAIRRLVTQTTEK